MANEPTECFRCRGRLEVGFLVDFTSGGQQVQRWLAGEPRVSRWIGLKVDSKDLVEVRTYRCQKCGLLESHAG